MEPLVEKVAKRNTKKILINKPNVGSLKELNDQLTDEQRGDFRKKYGNILWLLFVDVQVDAISALAQYYDPPYRCFTFQDFQLVPTLEEFSQILGYPLGNGKPYHYNGSPYSWKYIASVLQFQESELESMKKTSGATNGISREQLEKKLKALDKNREWERFMDLLALTIYGVLLFPSADGLISLAAIGVFIKYKREEENPVTAVLADVFYTLNICRGKSGKRMLCCLPALYVWMTCHVFKRGDSRFSPIADFRSLRLRPKDANEWKNILAELKGEEVEWDLNWIKATKVLYQCGDFSNVPLVGTKACINYNPALALRQFGYPMNGEPPKESYAPFIAELTDTEMLKRICRAWGKVIYKRNESGPKSCSSDELYKEWIKNRVAEIQLPFAISRNQGEASTIQEDSDEVKELKLKLKNLEDEKSALEDKFIKLNTSFKDLEYEVRDKTRSLEEANKRARIEEAGKDRTKDALFAANAGLRRLNADKRRLMLQNKRLRDAQREMRKGLNTLKTQVRDQVVANDELKMEFKKQLEKKQEELEEIKRGTVSGV